MKPRAEIRSHVSEISNQSSVISNRSSHLSSKRSDCATIAVTAKFMRLAHGNPEWALAKACREIVRLRAEARR